MEKAKHFVLVHGICHGAWCWYKLVNLLKSAGHQVSALDLGGCGINPRKLEEISSTSDYVQPLMEFLALIPQNERVILVAHSYGGLAISLAMEDFPEKILVAVYVTAFMPNYISPPATLVQEFFRRTPKESLLDSKFWYDNGTENLPTAALFGPNLLSTKLYQRCQVEDVELSKMLIRPNRLLVEDFAKENLLSKEKFGSIKRIFILCKQDDCLKEDFQQWMIENSLTNEVKLIAGADHMPMLSTPKELSLSLLEVAENFPY